MASNFGRSCKIFTSYAPPMARAGTFSSNIGVLQIFGINDHESARLASDLLGQGTVVFQTSSQAMDSDRSGLTFAEHHSGRSLLTPDEVRNLPQHQELLFVTGQRPVLAGKLRYYADRSSPGFFSGTNEKMRASHLRLDTCQDCSAFIVEAQSRST